MISLGQGLGKEGLLALKIVDTVNDVLEPLASRARRDPSRQLKPSTYQTVQESIDYVPPNAPVSFNRAHFVYL